MTPFSSFSTPFLQHLPAFFRSGYNEIPRGQPSDDFEQGPGDVCVVPNDEDGSFHTTPLKGWSAAPAYSAFLSLLCAFVPSPFRSDANGSRRSHTTSWLDGIRGLAAFFVTIHHASLVYFSWDIHMGWGYDPNPAVPRYVIQLPLIRLIIAGPPQVFLFFLLSGFALAYKPIKLIRQRRSMEFLNNMASAFFRRHSRLFIPAFTFGLITTTVLYAVGPPRASDWNAGAAVPRRDPPLTGHTDAGLLDWWWDWIQMARVMMNPMFVRDDSALLIPHDPNLWTLPREFTCSMVEFGILVALCNVRAWVMMAVLTLLLSYCVEYNFQSMTLFLIGMVLADMYVHVERARASATAGKPYWRPWAFRERQEAKRVELAATACDDAIPLHSIRVGSPLAPGATASKPDASAPVVSEWGNGQEDLERAEEAACEEALPLSVSVGSPSASSTTLASPTLPAPGVVPRWLQPPTASRVAGFARGALSLVVFLFSIHLLSIPERHWGSQTTPGYRTLLDLAPASMEGREEWFWMTMGSGLLVLTVAFTPYLQAMFNTSPVQYLGRISFSLYISHGPMLWNVASRIGRVVVDTTQPQTPVQFALASGVAYLLFLPFELWVADLIMTHIDLNAVALGRWTYNKLLAEPGSD